MALARCARSAALLVAGAECARVGRKHAKHASPGIIGTKWIAGIPVLNYDTAYEGVEISSEGEREGWWVVMAEEDATDAQIQQLCQSARNGCKLAGHRSGIPFLSFHGTESDIEVVINSVQGAVKYVEPDGTHTIDPEIESNNVEAGTWGLNRIGADLRGSFGASTTIFVLDTGVRITHTEFGGRALPALDVSSAPIECGDDLKCAADTNGHGTRCAGIAAGESFGVASAAAVRSIKVLGNSGSGDRSATYYALDWVAQSTTRPAVASISLGGAGRRQASADAVNAAVDAGVVVVVAGGNAKMKSCEFSPAFVPAAITVGATRSDDRRWGSSNYGSCTNIWAPGKDVASATHTSDIGSASFTGTSFACPYVAGAVALLLDADPSKKSSDLLDELLDNAVRGVITDLYDSDTNALVYVGAGGAPPTPVPAPTPARPVGCDPAFSTGPTSTGDCHCIRTKSLILTCYEDGKRGCTYHRTKPPLWWKADLAFAANCTSCICL